LAVRAVAEQAKVGKSTAATHLDGAVREGWLALVDVGTVQRRDAGRPDVVRVVDVSHARRFTLGPKALEAAGALLGHTKTMPCPAPPAVGDVFRRSFGGQRGLGAHQGRLYGLLRARSCTALELAAAFQVTVGQMRRHLRGLQREGLCVGGELWTAGACDPEAVATELGLAGATARQQVQHRCDSRGWTAWLAERARYGERQRAERHPRLRVCQGRVRRGRPAHGEPRRRVGADIRLSRQLHGAPQRPLGPADTPQRPLGRELEPCAADLASAAELEAVEARVWEGWPA
jgi:hypothetical protein